MQEQRQRKSQLETKRKDKIMPMVKGKKYPYTKKGMAAASKAKKKTKKVKK